MQETVEVITVLPVWTAEQQQLDFEQLKLSSLNTNVARLIAADIVARVVPMTCQGVDSGIAERVALLAFHGGKSAAQIQVLRRVGCRWLPEHREATEGVLIDWSAIRSACIKTPVEGNALDPVKVLVGLAKQRGNVSRGDFDTAYAEAEEASLPKPDVTEEPLTFDGLLGDQEEPPIKAEPTPLDNLTADIEAVSGRFKTSDIDNAKAAGAELLLWLEGANAPLAKFNDVKGTPLGEPIRQAYIAFVRRVIETVGIAPSELQDGSPVG